MGGSIWGITAAWHAKVIGAEWPAQLVKQEIAHLRVVDDIRFWLSSPSSKLVHPVQDWYGRCWAPINDGADICFIWDLQTFDPAQLRHVMKRYSRLPAGQRYLRR